MNTHSRRRGSRCWSVLWASVVSSLLCLPIRSAAQLYEHALPPAEVREYYYMDNSGFVYRGDEAAAATSSNGPWVVLTAMAATST